jgi:starch-binding outer membrane protein SusE/F
MKNLINKLLVVAFIAALVSSCKKDEQRAVITPGGSTTLTASSTTLVLDSASGGTKAGITFSWPSVNFGTQVAPTYTLQIDSVNGNFAKPVNINLGSGRSQSYTMGDFNTLVTSLGITPGTSGKIRARVKTEVNQVNGTTTSVPTTYSNVLDITVTPYSTKPKPMYTVPDSLYIVGDATPGGWNNPVPIPSQKFTKIDDNTFGIVINLTGGKQYLLLPKNGDWAHKYAVPGTPDPMSGSFVPDANNNIPAPATSGTYTIIVDFVKGTYTLTAGNPYNVPTNLFIVGDATAGQWNNPVPTPSQQFTRTSNGEYTITIPLTGGKSYLLLPVNGDWSHKFGGTGKTGGTLLYDNAVPGSNTPAPDATGTYKIYVNFFSKQYTVTQ